MPENPTNPGPARQTVTPVTPLDLMICRLRIWVEDMEKRQAEAEDIRRIPDDVPRFVTRYP